MKQKEKMKKIRYKSKFYWGFLKNLWYVVGVSKTSKKLNFTGGYYNPQ